MATRKSGDGSANAGSDRPGSYAKVSGSRRKRKGRRGSTMPPPASASLDEARIVDTVGESDDGRDSDLGDGAVDDLRRQGRPNSNRAPRKELGPLGIEDIRSEPPANTVASDRPREPSDRPRPSSNAPRMNVVEINAAEAPRSRLFDDEEDEVDEVDRELARQYEIDGGPADSDRRVSSRPARLARDDGYDTQEATLSSVLGARPSLRPTPRPETQQRDPASVMWWLVVCALVGIIAAAVAIAAREQFGAPEQAAAEPVAVEPATPPAVEAAKPPPVSFGLPQAREAKAAEVAPKPLEPVAQRTPVSPVPPSVVPAAQSAAVRPGAPGTSAVTGAARAQGTAASARRSTAAKPSDANKPAAGASYAPGYDQQLGDKPYAPGYSTAEPKPSPEPAQSPEPAKENKPAEPQGLPVNPYE